MSTMIMNTLSSFLPEELCVYGELLPATPSQITLKAFELPGPDNGLAGSNTKWTSNPADNTPGGSVVYMIHLKDDTDSFASISFEFIGGTGYTVTVKTAEAPGSEVIGTVSSSSMLIHLRHNDELQYLASECKNIVRHTAHTHCFMTRPYNSGCRKGWYCRLDGDKMSYKYTIWII